LPYAFAPRLSGRGAQIRRHAGRAFGAAGDEVQWPPTCGRTV